RRHHRLSESSSDGDHHRKSRGDAEHQACADPGFLHDARRLRRRAARARGPHRRPGGPKGLSQFASGAKIALCPINRERPTSDGHFPRTARTFGGHEKPREILAQAHDIGFPSPSTPKDGASENVGAPETDFYTTQHNALVTRREWMADMLKN